MNFVDSTEIFDRLLVIVHADVAVAVVQSLVPPSIAGDVECGGLAAPAVSSGLLTGFEGVDQSRAEFSLGFLEGLGHGIGYFLAREDVALHDEVLALLATGPLQALFSRECSHTTLGVDDTDLPVFATRVFRHQTLDDFFRRKTVLQELQAIGQELGWERARSRRPKEVDR